MCVGYCWATRPRELLARSPVVACSAKLLQASRSFLIPPGVVLVQVGWRCSKSQRDMLAAMHVCVRCPRKRETMNERTALFHMTVLSSDRDASSVPQGISILSLLSTTRVAPIGSARWREISFLEYSFLPLCVRRIICHNHFGGLPTASWPAVSNGLFTRVTLATYITMPVPELYIPTCLKNRLRSFSWQSLGPLARLKCVLLCVFSFRSTQVCSLVLSRLSIDSLPAGTCLPPPAFCAQTSV